MLAGSDTSVSQNNSVNESDVINTPTHLQEIKEFFHEHVS